MFVLIVYCGFAIWGVVLFTVLVWLLVTLVRLLFVCFLVVGLAFMLCFGFV